jgi:hypothetical protein
MLILMSRSPWLERDIGADRLTRWHAWGGPVVILLTVLHTLAVVAAWAETRSIDLMAATKDLLEISGLTTALVGTVILALVGFTSLRSVRRRISYEQWHILHLLTYLAVGFGFVHQLAGPASPEGGGCRLFGACCTPTRLRLCSGGGCCSRSFSSGGIGSGSRMYGRSRPTSLAF